MSATRTVYFVRGGTHQGAYLTLRQRRSKGDLRKYSWTNHKEKLVELSYNAARNAIRRSYGGTLVKRVYQGKKLISEKAIS